MSMRKAAQMREGETAFFLPEASVWDTRQAARQAALDKARIHPFVVTREELYYTDRLDQLLSTPDRLREAAAALDKDITGDAGGRVRCALLWEGGWDGVLLHRAGDELLCAYVPALTAQAAQSERELALTLAALAERAAGTPIMLYAGLRSGRHSLRDILRYLSEQMGV